MTDRWRLARIRRRLGEAIRDITWLLPVLGGLAGLLLALAVGTGGGPERDPWTVTVDRSRDTLLSSLALVFTALSVVLALASVAAQNVVSRFGSRVLRIYLRRSPTQRVTGAFALAAVFILVEQFQLRRLDPDAPAPIAGLVISAVLLVVVGGLVIWYISSLARWFRTDRATAVVIRSTRETARRIAHHDRAHAALTSLPARPDGAVDLPTRRSGHIAGIDAGAILAACRGLDATIVIDRRLGDPVVAGETIGWLANGTEAHVAAAAEALEISRTRELAEGLEYGIVALVDIAIIALSPAVNDPNSAVEVIEEMSFLFPELAEAPLGPFAMPAAETRPRVVMAARTFGDYVDLATEQIVQYGAVDPNVHRALRRLASSLQLLDLGEGDRARVDAFAARLTPTSPPSR